MWLDHDADENSRRLFRKLSCSVIKDRISSPLPDQVNSLPPSSLPDPLVHLIPPQSSA